jgi:hypothetical protein
MDNYLAHGDDPYRFYDVQVSKCPLPESFSQIDLYSPLTVHLSARYRLLGHFTIGKVAVFPQPVADHEGQLYS